jgi:RNA polymerase sigma-70 factor, ECF subfamily
MNTSIFSWTSPEAELLQRVCAGEKESFYKLVQPYERAIFAAAMCILRNEADAEEVSQESLMKAFCALPRFRGDCKFSTWLIQITINESRAKLRKNRSALYESMDVQRPDDDRYWFPKDFADGREIPSQELERREIGDALKRALDSLPSRYRDVLVLRDVEDMSTQETAQVLGVTQGCIKTRLLRARLQMRDALTPKLDGSSMNGRFEFGKVRQFVE